LRRQDPLRRSLPRAGDPRQAALPHAWRAAGSGAPQGNRNARKHGLFTREAIVARNEVRTLMDEARDFLRKLT
jgi:hypothetical protein